MYAVIDVETTGGSAAKDRITEIAIVVHDGQRIVREFATLLNPERPIPLYITDITGISDDMVADAPRFYEVAREIVALTEGCTFVAHNVNFDYGFIREEFMRLGYPYQRERLCTVRLSRELVPGLPSYSLGPLCNHLGIPNHARHRAKGDADATVRVLEHLLRLRPGLTKAAKRTVRDPFEGIPAHVDRKSLQALPEEPGLYFFHGAGGKVVYQNAAPNIRQAAIQVLQKLAKGPMSGLPALHDVCELSHEETGNLLVAMLRLEQERQQALATQAARASGKPKFGVLGYQDQRGYLRLYVDRIGKGKAAHGQFATEDDARAALEARLRKYRLCAQMGGLETGADGCTWLRASEQLCTGACLGLESAEDYNERLKAALLGLGMPHPAFFILGEGRKHGELAVVGVEDGSVIGYAYLDETLGYDDPHWVKSLLKPLPATEHTRDIVRNYLSKNMRTKLLPF